MRFANTQPDWIKLRADFKVNGKSQCAEKEIALVMIDLYDEKPKNPGWPTNSDVSKTFLDYPPTPPPTPPPPPNWITVTPPGAQSDDCSVFTYNGTSQPPEPGYHIETSRYHEVIGGYTLYASFSLIAPQPARKDWFPLDHIQVGIIQDGYPSGSATYATVPPGHKRTIAVPTTKTLDWINECPHSSDKMWPWYDKHYTATGKGDKEFPGFFAFTDSPSMSFPALYNPLSTTDPNAHAPLESINFTQNFTARFGARTLDSDLGADKLYFDEGHARWAVNYNQYPPDLTKSIVQIIDDHWVKPGSASKISVDVVPTVTNGTPPFLQWLPDRH